MKHMAMIFMLVSVFLMSACTSFSTNGRSADVADSGKSAEPVQKSVRTSDPSIGHIRIQDDAGSVMLQKVAFRPGVSSVSVERLAKRANCTGGAGAGLITEKGPVEVYRMQCENGTTFMAQCELRQCRPMR